ncbi:AraC family transcriptional regulator [Sphingobacteriaceae bacterium]|nr:AraC family transcriptional regulator [Sphingobacteriaceae bacterium]
MPFAVFIESELHYKYTEEAWFTTITNYALYGTIQTFLYFYSMKSLPVYKIKDFRKFSEENVFYSNDLKAHVKFHDFTNSPHKHDFYFAVLFTKGSGTHEIDFKKYPVKTGSLFLLKPGQMHNWKLSADCEGFIFFHTRDFYDTGFTSEHLQDFPFFSSHHSSPLLVLKGSSFLSIKELANQINEEYQKNDRFKLQKLRALVNLVYIETSRQYSSPTEGTKENYLEKLKKFETLIDGHFKDHITASDYAALMNISEKHLNRICKTCLDKTSTDLISDRMILEAKRLLLQSKWSVTQIAAELAFKDNSYFNRFFKKRTGETPLGFLEKYR